MTHDIAESEERSKNVPGKRKNTGWRARSVTPRPIGFRPCTAHTKRSILRAERSHISEAGSPAGETSSKSAGAKVSSLDRAPFAARSVAARCARGACAALVSKAVCKHVSRPHGTDEFWPHPRTGGRQLTLAPDDLFSLAALVHRHPTDPNVEQPSEPYGLRALEPKQVLTNTKAGARACMRASTRFGVAAAVPADGASVGRATGGRCWSG